MTNPNRGCGTAAGEANGSIRNHAARTDSVQSQWCGPTLKHRESLRAATPLGLRLNECCSNNRRYLPRVAEFGNPWAFGRNPVGVATQSLMVHWASLHSG